MQLPPLSPQLIIFSVFCFGFLIQLFYYLFIFSRLAFYRKKPCKGNTPPVSIIICARNEDDNLTAYLPIIMAQDYPEYEVIVVNDCSFDNTPDVLKEFEKKHSNFRTITIKEDEYYKHGKKFAIMVGIKGAKYEDLLFTDADCKPNSDQWIKNMICELKGEAEIVLGYGGYEKEKGLLNKLIRFDTFQIAQQYLSFCLAGRTYMGVGRNLAYKKSLFFKIKGFASHYFIESGDDDLFVNEAATKRNSKVEIAVQSHTVSKPKTSYREWLRQKRRHVSTSSFYNFKTKFRLGMLFFSQWILYIGLVATLLIPVQQFPYYVPLCLFGFRLLVQLIVFKLSMDKLCENDLIWLTPFFELMLMFFYPLVMVSKLFVKKSKWTKT
jgi:glycosyltransferase involved in cell wall biosynthesis